MERQFSSQYKLNTTAVVLLMVCLMIEVVNEFSEFLYERTQVYYCVDDCLAAIQFTLLTVYFAKMVK